MRRVSHSHGDRSVGSGTTPESPSRRDFAHAFALTFVLLATAGFLVARIPVLTHRPFDLDEFEHAHAAWCAFKGMLPYKDFFEHHTPWYHYTLAPFFHWFDVDLSFESAKHFLLFGRGLSLALTTLSIVLLALIGRLWKDRRVGLVAGLLLVGQPFFFQKTTEIRPDVLGLPFFLAGLGLLLRGLAADTDEMRRRLRCFVAAGLSLGAAVMCTQKMLFVLPGAFTGLVFWSLFAGRGRNQRIFLTLSCLLGACIPVVLTWAAFAFEHAGREFMTNNFLLNASWKHVEAEQFGKLIKTSRPVLALSILGVSVSLFRFIRFEQRQYGDILLFCTLAGLFAGLLVVPVAYRQYYLMPLPIVCLFAAHGLLILVECARQGVRSWLLVVAIVLLGVLPVLELRAALKLRNDNQLAKLRYVFDNTKPTDVVMDGWEGMGVFRPHAFYYFFLHGEFVDRLPREQVDAYLAALEGGRIRPRLIAMDENLVSLGSRFLRFVKTNYVRREMPGQDRQAGSEWRRFFKKILRKNDVEWEGFYFSRDGFD